MPLKGTLRAASTPPRPDMKEDQCPTLTKKSARAAARMCDHCSLLTSSPCMLAATEKVSIPHVKQQAASHHGTAEISFTRPQRGTRPAKHRHRARSQPLTHRDRAARLLPWRPRCRDTGTWHRSPGRTQKHSRFRPVRQPKLRIPHWQSAALLQHASQ